MALVVIPARLGSTRFPRKVLARDTGKYLVQHVWEGVAGAPGVSRVIIATDSEEVARAARSFHAEVRLTSPLHRSGTDRVAEVAAEIADDIVVNVQGDEPLVRGEDLGRLIGLFEEGGAPVVMTTLAVERSDREGHQDPNCVKVVMDAGGRALFFSRAAIPSGEAADGSQETVISETARWHQHIGIYGYRRDFLLRFAALPPGALEKRERLEQLRALENGYSIRVALTRHSYRGIDTAEEYQDFVREYASQGSLPHGSIPGGGAGGEGIAAGTGGLSGGR